MPRRAILQTDSTFMASDVGLRLRQARLERRMSLAQLGGTELTRGFISAVETGRSSISLKALSYLANRLDLPITYFLEGQEDSRTLAPEFELEEAEQRLRTGKASEALELLMAVTPPTQLRVRHAWLHGWALHDLGRPREAIPVLEGAVSAVDSDLNPRESVSLHYVLAMVLHSASNEEESLERLREAHALALQLGDDALLATITVALGHVYLALGQSDVAMAQYERARQLFESVDDLANLAGMYTGLSRLHRQQGDLRGAIRYARLGLGIWEAAQNARLAAKELANISARYEEMGDADKALEVGLDAVRRAQESTAPDVEALARSSLAAAYLRRGDVEEAREQAQAVQRLGLSPDDAGTVDAIIVLAKVAEQLGEHDQADQLFGQALDALEQIGPPGRFADVALAYSESLTARGNLAAALDYARRAANKLTARPA